MRFKRTAAVLLALVFLAGCRSSQIETEPTDAGNATETVPGGTASPDMIRYTPGASAWGEPDRVAVYNDDLDFEVYYPRLGIPPVDQELYNWVCDLYDEVNAEVKELCLFGTLSVGFNSYLASDHYLGIEEIGAFKHDQMQDARDVVMTFNADIQNRRILENSEILDMARADEILDLLRSKIVYEYPDWDRSLTAGRLDRLVLHENGVAVLLPRGVVSEDSISRFSLSRDELGDLFILGQSAPPERPPETNGNQPPPESATPRPAAPPLVALTFDDGPSAVTPRILDTLEKYGVKATFFVLGSRVDGYPETMKRILADGHEIMGHSWEHKQLTTLSASGIRDDLTKTADAIYQASGVWPALYRPPYGSVNQTVRDVSAELGLSIINWSVDTEDWKSRNADTVYDVVMNQTRNGSIILLHDLYGTTADAVERIVPALLEKG